MLRSFPGALGEEELQSPAGLPSFPLPGRIPFPCSMLDTSHMGPGNISEQQQPQQADLHKFNIAALLEDHLLLPDGFDLEDGDPGLLGDFLDKKLQQSESIIGEHTQPCRDPAKDTLLASLHALEAYCPALMAAVLDSLLLLHSVLFLGVLALSTASTYVLWHQGLWPFMAPALVLLLLHYPVTMALLAAYMRQPDPESGGGGGLSSGLLTAAALPLWDAGMIAALPPLQHASLRTRKRWAQRWPSLAALELRLWHYRACRMVVLAAAHCVPIIILLAVALASGHVRSALTGSELGVLAGTLAASALYAVMAACDMALNARWAGQMPLLQYTLLVLQMSGSKKLPMSWQKALFEDVKLVIKPDAPDFFDLHRPQQCQVLRLALQRPHFALSNVVTHPKPPPHGGKAAASAATAEAGAFHDMRAAAPLPWLLRLLLGSAWPAGAPPSRKGSASSSGDSNDSEESAQQQAHRSACLLLQSKAAVKMVTGLLQGPLAAARHTLHGEFTVNLSSFSDAAACRHCRVLLDLLLRQGLRCMLVTDAKLQIEYFQLLARHLPRPTCALRKLVLKDVLGAGISTLCLLCEALPANQSVQYLDLANNQLWGMRGAHELRNMLRRNSSLRVLLMPFCGVASQGAIEVFKGAAECPTLERIDFSQNHISDDVPDWSDVEFRNLSMKEVDLSFNWIQDSMAGWAASLLEAFPTLARLHLNHNSDSAASRYASAAPTPCEMTPRTLTPSKLRVTSFTAAGGASAGGAATLAPGAAPGGAAAAPAGQNLASPLIQQQSQPAPASMPSQPTRLGPTASSRSLTTTSQRGRAGQQVSSGQLVVPSRNDVPGPVSGHMLKSAPTSEGAMISPFGAQFANPSARISAAAAIAASMPTAGAPGRPLPGPVAQLQQQHSALRPSFSVNSANEWQASLVRAAAELPGRSRGQHLIAHLAMYATGGCAAAAPPFMRPNSAVGRAGMARDSVPCSRQGSLPNSAAMMRGSREISGPSGGAGSGGEDAAPSAACPRPPGQLGSLWHAVAGMERLDLRGLPLPSWWARSLVHRPASVVIDEPQVYAEEAGFVGLELPQNVEAALEAGIAEGCVAIDLCSPEYRTLSRCQQLVAIYRALAYATHIVITNTSMAGPLLPVPPSHPLYSAMGQASGLFAAQRSSTLRRAASGTTATALSAGPSHTGPAQHAAYPGGSATEPGTVPAASPHTFSAHPPLSHMPGSMPLLRAASSGIAGCGPPLSGNSTASRRSRAATEAAAWQQYQHAHQQGQVGGGTLVSRLSAMDAALRSCEDSNCSLPKLPLQRIDSSDGCSNSNEHEAATQSRAGDKREAGITSESSSSSMVDGDMCTDGEPTFGTPDDSTTLLLSRMRPPMQLPVRPGGGLVGSTFNTPPSSAPASAQVSGANAVAPDPRPVNLAVATRVAPERLTLGPAPGAARAVLLLAGELTTNTTSNMSPGATSPGGFTPQGTRELEQGMCNSSVEAEPRALSTMSDRYTDTMTSELLLSLPVDEAAVSAAAGAAAGAASQQQPCLEAQQPRAQASPQHRSPFCKPSMEMHFRTTHSQVGAASLGEGEAVPAAVSAPGPTEQQAHQHRAFSFGAREALPCSDASDCGLLTTATRDLAERGPLLFALQPACEAQAEARSQGVAHPAAAVVLAGAPLHASSNMQGTAYMSSSRLPHHAGPRAVAGVGLVARPPSAGAPPITGAASERFRSETGLAGGPSAAAGRGVVRSSSMGHGSLVSAVAAGDVVARPAGPPSAPPGDLSGGAAGIPGAYTRGYGAAGGLSLLGWPLAPVAPSATNSFVELQGMAARQRVQQAMMGQRAGVAATNAVSVVLVVGGDGMLRVPLRCLEMPLKAAMARRPGTTVTFRLNGLSHNALRQLRALMMVAKVPVPDRTNAWLLPNSAGHSSTNIRHSASHLQTAASGMSNSPMPHPASFLGALQQQQLSTQASRSSNTGLHTVLHPASSVIGSIARRGQDLGFILAPSDLDGLTDLSYSQVDSDRPPYQYTAAALQQQQQVRSTASGLFMRKGSSGPAMLPPPKAPTAAHSGQLASGPLRTAHVPHAEAPDWAPTIRECSSRSSIGAPVAEGTSGRRRSGLLSTGAVSSRRCSSLALAAAALPSDASLHLAPPPAAAGTADGGPAPRHTSIPPSPFTAVHAVAGVGKANHPLGLHCTQHPHVPPERSDISATYLSLGPGTDEDHPSNERLAGSLPPLHHHHANRHFGRQRPARASLDILAGMPVLDESVQYTGTLEAADRTSAGQQPTATLSAAGTASGPLGSTSLCMLLSRANKSGGSPDTGAGMGRRASATTSGAFGSQVDVLPNVFGSSLDHNVQSASPQRSGRLLVGFGSHSEQLQQVGHHGEAAAAAGQQRSDDGPAAAIAGLAAQRQQRVPGGQVGVASMMEELRAAGVRFERPSSDSPDLRA